MNKYMKIAVEEAFTGMRKGDGGPFGAVIVKDGEIIAQAHNEVIKTNDPTMHAEINAIRQATKKLGRFDLSDCEIYSSCEPCPMCFAAIHWAKMKSLYFGASREDAADIGFDDQYIYDVINKTADHEQVHTRIIDCDHCNEPFKEWKQKEDKTQY
ncbi:nucleoside deaminase [Candidatus Xianfuyuplasma coldseepsis]|uniref:Nucleoside deaminase n=1 Tax=Candidatus Xianfuyuplasma coldseepsis TaxID=2782163 RepID=A0A7L7KPC6_9MOLU|nr:nucleoside deaminase [Xianfuyuplasma coldseepsis]QMS84395.1 nucleoside deaminase [Xianfuyuplasma coldseepsis]